MKDICSKEEEEEEEMDTHLHQYLSLLSWIHLVYWYLLDCHNDASSLAPPFALPHFSVATYSH